MMLPPKRYEGLIVLFNTTEECNLRCEYCYQINKKPLQMKLEDAKKFIDFILTDPDPIKVRGTPAEWMIDGNLILEFIGGESLADPKMIRNIMYYFMWKAQLQMSPYANRWQMSISTNGTYFGRQDVRDLLDEFSGTISLGVSIDGVPEIQDRYRVFPDGSGSSDIVLKNWPWYLDYCKRSGFEPNTKSTLSRESLKYLSSSLKYLHETLGLRHIFMNFAIEALEFNDEDIEILDRELEKCYHYAIEHKDDMFWTMFDRQNIGEPFNETNKTRSRCGTGRMPTLSVNGFIYPCLRWLPASMGDSVDTTQFSLGSVNDFDKNKKVFELIQAQTDWEISDEDCRNCAIQTACQFCLAGCYNEFGKFRRTKHSCRATKLLSKWTAQFWKTIEELKSETESNVQ